MQRLSIRPEECEEAIAESLCTPDHAKLRHHHRPRQN
jgi:hypothetical protein